MLFLLNGFIAKPNTDNDNYNNVKYTHMNAGRKVP